LLLVHILHFSAKSHQGRLPQEQLRILHQRLSHPWYQQQLLPLLLLVLYQHEGGKMQGTKVGAVRGAWATCAT
jgi:hypothetical protein